MRDCLQNQHCRRQIKATSFCSKKAATSPFLQPSSAFIYNPPQSLPPQTKRTSSLQFRERAHQAYEAKISILIERKVLSPVDPERLFQVWICQHLEFWNYPPSRRDTRFHIHSRKKSGAFSPNPEKPQKSRQRHQKRAHRRASNTGLQMALLMPGHVTKLKPSPAQYTHFSYSNLCVYIIKSLLNFADSLQHGISQLWRGYTSILQISIERSWR